MYDTVTKYRLWGNSINLISGGLFLIGSIFFFFSRANLGAFYAGVALFTIGSILFVIGPGLIIKPLLAEARAKY
ncbi:MAG: YrhK family protein [Nitrososphaerales archaeon]